MRITFMLPHDNLTGGNRVVATYAQILQARGHRVHVINNAPPPLTVREGLRMLRHGLWGRLQQRLWPRPGHIALSGVPQTVLERRRPITASDLPDADVLVATWWETAVWMHAMPPSKGSKVHLIQGYEVWGGSDLVEPVHAALRLPNLKVAISSGLKRDIEGVLGDLNMAVVPNAVDLGLFDAAVRPRNPVPSVGFIYAQTPLKGADRCARAIALARQQVPDLQVVAFGADPAGADMPLPPGTQFTHRPSQHRLASLYASCDAWLFASRLDSFGLPILEAMACRTPVIGVPIGAAPDVLTDGAGVLLTDVSEDELCAAMAAAIVRLCRMPADDWQRMSDTAYQRARSYSWNDATDRLETLLQAAVTGSTGDKAV